MREYDLAGGNTNPETFPTTDIARVAAKAIADLGGDLARYPGDLGHAGLRQLMAHRESIREGIAVDPDHISLTNGSMQAVTLMAEALMNKPGDVIIVEELCYMGTLYAYKEVGAKLVGIPLDEHGMRLDRLEESLEQLHRAGTPPAFIYTTSTYQNPTGAVMPRAQRLELIEVARRFDTIIVEDNCYADVHFEGDKQPALYALDDSPNQVYICSVSKILGPGVRLGYFLARPPMLERILERRADGGNSLLAAAVIAEYFRDELWSHIDRANDALRVKRDALIETLSEHLGDICTWSHPVGGLFLWLRFPDDVDTGELARLAAAEGVRYVPGSQFHFDGADVSCLRLAFGHAPEADIREGIPLLAQCIRAAHRDVGSSVEPAAHDVSEPLAPARAS